MNRKRRLILLMLSAFLGAGDFSLTAQRASAAAAREDDDSDGRVVGFKPQSGLEIKIRYLRTLENPRPDGNRASLKFNRRIKLAGA